MALEAGQTDQLPRSQLQVRRRRTRPGAAPRRPGAAACRPRVPPSTGLPRSPLTSGAPAADRGRSPMSSRDATVVPVRSTVTTVLISNTSSIRWEMNTTLAPRAVMSRTTSKSRSRVATSSAEVDSSSTRTCGSVTSERATQHACRSDSDSASTGPSTSIGVPSRRPITSAARARWSARVPAERRAPSHTFSAMDRPGTVKHLLEDRRDPARAGRRRRPQSAGGTSVDQQLTSGRAGALRRGS